MERTQFVFKHKVPVATYAGYKLQQHSLVALKVHYIGRTFLSVWTLSASLLARVVILNIYFVYIKSFLMTLWSLSKLLPCKVTGHRVVPLLAGKALWVWLLLVGLMVPS